MRKRDEMTDPASCLNRAPADEIVFVLRGKDPAAPAAIRAWAVERVRLGSNRPDDPQLTEAEECARVMEAERAAEAPGPPGPDAPTVAFLVFLVALLIAIAAILPYLP